jgi:hypothetical protein
MQISDEQSGRNAATVIRDKATGRKRNLAEEQAKKAEEDAAKNVVSAKYEEWNKGLVVSVAFLCAFSVNLKTNRSLSCTVPIYYLVLQPNLLKLGTGRRKFKN